VHVVQAMTGESDGQLFTLEAADSPGVAARLLRPQQARACYVLAHGAGAGMDHPAMRAIACDLAALGVATLRFQFPYMQRGSRRPDPPPVCHATVRAAVAAAARLAPDLPRFAGGRSFGGRMSSQAQALEPLPGVRGLAFLGFPLHPAGRPAVARAAHLADVHLPMLFLQGSNDALADPALLRALIARLGERATLSVMDGADHSFHVPKKSGRSDSAVRGEVLQRLTRWLDTLL
jgi:uncharacterized protein